MPARQRGMTGSNALASTRSNPASRSNARTSGDDSSSIETDRYSPLRMPKWRPAQRRIFWEVRMIDQRGGIEMMSLPPGPSRRAASGSADLLPADIRPRLNRARHRNCQTASLQDRGHPPAAIAPAPRTPRRLLLHPRASRPNHRPPPRARPWTATRGSGRRCRNQDPARIGPPAHEAQAIRGRPATGAGSCLIDTAMPSPAPAHRGTGSGPVAGQHADENPKPCRTHAPLDGPGSGCHGVSTGSANQSDGVSISAETLASQVDTPHTRSLS